MRGSIAFVRTARGLLGIALAGTLVVALAAPSGAYPRSLRPRRGLYFGARVEAQGGETLTDALRRVERQIGRKFAIDHAYYSWGAHIPTSHQRWDVDTGRIPFVNWRSGYPWSSIANGSHDDWIRSRAEAFKDFGHPIYLTFHHEPENDLSRFGTPEAFARAFRHIVTIFRRRGADNVAFVWTMMSWSFNPRSGRDPNPYYPGNRYVDFVGADGYNWYPGRPGTEWTSFREIFSDVNRWSVRHDKPWMAVEYGCQEDRSVPGRKARWFRRALATARNWRHLKALMYFDVDADFDWTTDTSSSSITAYRAIANTAYAGG
jgi:hypothetical protein